MEIQRPQNMTELQNTIRAEWSTLLKVVSMLTPEQMEIPDAGGWSPKDNLAHLSEWLKVLFGYYMDKHPAHEVIDIDPALTEKWDFEAMNRIFFERNKPRSIVDVIGELKRLHAELFTRLDGMTFEDLMEPFLASDKEKYPLLLAVVNNTSDHYAEHRATIEKVLKA